MNINVNKRKSMIIGNNKNTHSMELNGLRVLCNNGLNKCFKYLGSIIEENSRWNKELEDKMG